MSLRGQITFADSTRAITRYSNALGTTVKKRSMSNMRLFASAAALLLGIFLSYCSLFYLPAFASDSQILRMSSEAKVTPQLGHMRSKKGGWFTPYLDLLRMKRGYMVEGSEIEAIFAVSQPAQMTFAVTQCKKTPVVEVFKCNPINDSRVTVEKKHTGLVRFTIEEPGFYYVTESIKSISGDPAEYSVIWRRK